MAGDVWFGAFVPQGWRGELASIPEPEARWERAIATALRAEELGYRSVWLYDQLPGLSDPADESVLECWTTMAALTQHTSQIRLGQIVGCDSYSNPSLVAKIAASMDVMSGGRLEWGISAGAYEWGTSAGAYEHATELGGAAPAKERIHMLRESVEIVQAMWTEPVTNYEGRYYSVRDAHCDPKPLSQPYPPILIGGGGPELTLRVVARLADRATFSATPEGFAEKCEALAAHCADVGRDCDEIEKVMFADVSIRTTESEIEPPATLPLSNLVGTPRQVAEKIRDYVEVGCRGFILWCSDYPDLTNLRLLAEEVMPQFI